MEWRWVVLTLSSLFDPFSALKIFRQDFELDCRNDGNAADRRIRCDERGRTKGRELRKAHSRRERDETGELFWTVFEDAF